MTRGCLAYNVSILRLLPQFKFFFLIFRKSLPLRGDALLIMKHAQKWAVWRFCVVNVCCSVLQCVAVCCSVLQCVAACCSVFQSVAVCSSVLRGGAWLIMKHAQKSALWLFYVVNVCCSVWQCAAVCCSVLQGGAWRIMKHAQKWAVWLFCVANVCCSIWQCLQRVAVCCSVL